MTERRLVQRLPMGPPLRQVSVHQRNESVVVMRFGEVDQLVDDDVLEALYGLLGEFEV